MGIVCPGAEENAQRIQELEDLLKKQELEKAKIEEKFAVLVERRESQGATDKLKEEVEKLQSEKKQVFKSMLKERKNCSKLEDEIKDSKKKIRELEEQMIALKYEREQSQSQSQSQSESQKSKSKTTTITVSDSSPYKGIKPHNGNTFDITTSTLAGIDIPNYKNIPSYKRRDSDSYSNKRKNRDRVNLRVNVKPNDSSTTDDDELSVSCVSTSVERDSSSSSDDDDIVTTKSSFYCMDIEDGFNAQTDVQNIYSWIHNNKKGVKNKARVKGLKMKLASLLTARSETYRMSLIDEYYEQYNKNMEKEIKSVIVKGHAMEIIHSLLIPRSVHDAKLIKNCVADWKLNPVAEIICCRTTEELKELLSAYKRENKLNMTKQLQALAQKDKKKTLVKVIGTILDPKRVENAEVDMNDVNKDLEFVLKSKQFKDDTKTRLILIFCGNSTQYVRLFNKQFMLNSKKDSLCTFIDKKLGPKSTAGHFCKTRIMYALDTAEYYADKIKKLGGSGKFKKNQKKIADIFIQRMEVDLDRIQRVWKINKYSDNGKDLKTWVLAKTKGSKSGMFLAKMLENCPRYNNAANANSLKGSKIEQLLM